MSQLSDFINTSLHILAAGAPHNLNSEMVHNTINMLLRDEPRPIATIFLGFRVKPKMPK